MKNAALAPASGVAEIEHGSEMREWRCAFCFWPSALTDCSGVSGGPHPPTAPARTPSRGGVEGDREAANRGTRRRSSSGSTAERFVPPIPCMYKRDGPMDQRACDAKGYSQSRQSEAVWRALTPSVAARPRPPQPEQSIHSGSGREILFYG